MDFFSEQLVSSDYSDRLRTDLQQADVCRFLVAYISGDGINAIGRRDLIRVLRHDDSFGIGSLSCSCKYAPLLNLQQSLGISDIRLKYFMDPMVEGADEPEGIVLFHSKLVYLRLPNQNKSVVYVGSHNWTGKALGPSSHARNVEASLRIEFDYSPEHLTGGDSSIPGQVNRHLLAAFGKPACLPATSANEAAFEQWYQWGCCRADPSPLQKITIILTALKGGITPSDQEWMALPKQGLYLQALEENEGALVRKLSDNLLVMVWRSPSDLQAGVPPVLLRCRASTLNAGPMSELQATNKAVAPVAGFGAAIYDDAQLRDTQLGSSRPQRSAVPIWSGRSVELFDFEFRQQPSDSAQIDGSVIPKYRFHLEVDSVVFPIHQQPPDDAEMMWTPESFAVAKSENEARLERVEGYYVPQELRAEILLYLTEDLMVDRDKAGNLPVAECNTSREGKRFSRHPLHDTFLGKSLDEEHDQFYAKTRRGSLVAEIDHRTNKGQHGDRQKKGSTETVARIQTVLTTKLKTLEHEWASIAARVRGSRKNREPE